jgi:hypothetical protein
MPMNPRLLRPLAKARFRALRVGLVAYWPFEEDAPSGDVTAIDWTGRGNDLTSNNSVLSTTGKVGLGRELVAANSEFLSRASNTDLQFGDGDWTLSAWVYVPDRADGEGYVIGKDQSGGREVIFSNTVTAATTVNRFTFIVFHTDGSLISGISNARTKANFVDRWWHYVIINAAGAVTQYLNGVSEGTATRAGGKTFIATNTPFNVGRRSFSGAAGHLTGTVDELAKWTRALSASEVSALYNGGTGIDLRT